MGWRWGWRRCYRHPLHHLPRPLDYLRYYTRYPPASPEYELKYLKDYKRMLENEKRVIEEEIRLIEQRVKEIEESLDKERKSDGT